jgi:glycosyltransferase involved in cell wall biosynthesis
MTFVGVCLPVHNEQDTLPETLAALTLAIHNLVDTGVACRLAVVLDDCSDGSEGLVRQWTSEATDIVALVVNCSAHNVGVARQTGCLALIESCASLDLSQIWLATTDADSEVPPQWLTHQVECMSKKIDFWAGRVEVSDWSDRHPGTTQLWNRAYCKEPDPIHGANLGINAELFLKVGGFAPLATGEDEALRRAVSRTSSTVFHDRRMPVKTSARVRARAPLGFAHYMDSLDEHAIGSL